MGIAIRLWDTYTNNYLCELVVRTVNYPTCLSWVTALLRDPYTELAMVKMNTQSHNLPCCPHRDTQVQSPWPDTHQLLLAVVHFSLRPLHLC